MDEKDRDVTKLIPALCAVAALLAPEATLAADAQLFGLTGDASTGPWQAIGTSNPLPVTVTTTAAGITPVVSASLEASHVLKATSGNLYSVYVSNLTGGSSGFLEVFNATSAPTDGAVTPIDCAPFVSGVAQIYNGNMPPSAYSTGIVAVISSSTTCFTKTTGTLTGFINGKVK